jgi:hypothetical protein
MSDRPTRPSSEKLFDLTIRDRINFPFLLAEQVTTFQKAILNKDFSRKEVEEAIKGFKNLLPTRWEDDDFKKDIKEAVNKVTIDIRPTFAGVSMSERMCKAKKIPMTEDIELMDYFKVLKSCINLLDRRGMLSKREYTEAPTGMPFGEEALPEGMNLQEYIASLAEEGLSEEEMEQHK